jgi:hypothetical protein
VRRLGLTGLLLACAALLSSCENADPGAGSNTNWLRSCDKDADCGELSCLCGVCTAPCDDSCPELPGAVCAAPASASVRALCGGDAAAPVAASGMCLPACGKDTECDAGQLCVDGSCLLLGGVNTESSCVAGARVTLSAGEVALEARYGTLFGDALYLPVAYDVRPTNWTEPMTPTPIVATVTTPKGDPVAGCSVRFVTGDGSGSAFADAPKTDKNGQAAAYWVAGDQRRQSLIAAVVDAKGAVQSASVDGTAYANDEGPQATDAAATVATRPATVRLWFDLPATSNRMRVVLSASTYPHHAFYSAMNIDGFFAGLQNTSELDALTDDVPEADHVLIASVWNLDEGDAQQLYGMEGLACGPHYQDLGGIRCLLGGAWQPETDYVFELERTTLAMGEAGPDYAALGYVTDPCASAAGCTDYTLFFGPAAAVDDLTRVVAYRYQSAELATGFGSFIQPYSELPAQNSCLFTPEYAAHFLPSVENGAGFEPVLNADFSAAYLSWHNEVCANYAATPDAGGFQLVTGGPRPLGRPELPNDPPRQLTLP